MNLRMEMIQEGKEVLEEIQKIKENYEKMMINLREEAANELCVTVDTIT
jgi:hypothetical protein